MLLSSGEAGLFLRNDVVEWHVPTKDAGSVSGTVTLRCTVVGPLSADDEEEEDDSTNQTYRPNPLVGYYDEASALQHAYHDSSESKSPVTTSVDVGPPMKSARKSYLNASLMPTSVSVSFSVR